MCTLKPPLCNHSCRMLPHNHRRLDVKTAGSAQHHAWVPYTPILTMLAGLNLVLDPACSQNMHHCNQTFCTL